MTEPAGERRLPLLRGPLFLYSTFQNGGWAMDNLVKKLGGIYRALAIVFLVLLLASVFIQILMRNILLMGSTGLEELSRVSLVSLIYLMVPVIAMRDEHIRVDLLLMRWKKGAKRANLLAIQLVNVSFCLVFLVAVSQIMRRNWNVTTPALRIPNAVFYLPIVLGFLLLILVCVNVFWKYLRGEEVAPPPGGGRAADNESERQGRTSV